MRKLLAALLIIGSLTGLEASPSPCKLRKLEAEAKLKQQKKIKQEKHKAANKRSKEAFRDMKRRHKEEKQRQHWYCADVFQTRPVDRLLADNGRVKRDSNGDRI